ncbi:hypothetical protein AB0K00_15605 [Dactylosporangium sp. NPDC049525]|uniref:hypothetical protein n=1 Tax=Dactylosporangium sp. NPDC049525 TaxID=3154730 RepID=UPI00342996E4
MIVSTDLAWPAVVELLDALSPGRREPWRLDGRVEVDRFRRWRLGPDEVKLDVQAPEGVGEQAIGLLRTLLEHGGSGSAGLRRWTLPVFEQAVRAGGQRCAELLAEPALDTAIDAVPSGELLGWGVVANVVRERLHGEDLEVRSGLKQFTGGTKVWVSRPWSGDGGERLWVVGPARRTRRPVRVIVPRIHLEHPRARAVYSPALLRRLDGMTRMLHDTLGSSQRWAEALATRVLEAEVDSPRRWLRVSDPPPMELDVDGTTVHLAHFNHRRARYSALEPPTEP